MVASLLDIMKSSPVRPLLGLAAFLLHSAVLEDLPTATVTLWPPGLKIYSGEDVFLQCRVVSNSSLAWTYRWHRSEARTHSISGDSYSIVGVRREDAGGYWCTAEEEEGGGRSSTVEVVLDVSAPLADVPPVSLTLTPDSKQILKGENFTVRCRSHRNPSTNWTVRYLSPVCPGWPAAYCSHTCPTEEGACVKVSAADGDTGLYWCEGAGERSRAVNVTVVYSKIALETPASPVHAGDDVALVCRFKTKRNRQVVFHRGELEISRFNLSSSEDAVTLTIESVTESDEGYYTCSSLDRRMRSQASWLSVSPDEGSWKWFAVSCAVILLLAMPLSVWIIHRSLHHQPGGLWRCWSSMPLPETKQDVTEVQWDFSLLEMTNLMDKQIYPGSS